MSVIELLHFKIRIVKKHFTTDADKKQYLNEGGESANNGRKSSDSNSY